MTGRLTFITVNGYQKSVTEQVATINKLLDGFEAVAFNSNTRTLETSLGSEIVIRLTYLRDLFARMVQAPQLDEDIIAQKPVLLGHLDTRGREQLRTDLTFVVGVANDPYLYASEPEAYQQAAVVGLHKAMAVLTFRIEHLTKRD